MGLAHKVVWSRRWRERIASKFHAGHFGGAPGLTLVTGLARAHQVLPGMFTPEKTWHDMIYGEILGLLSAVLADVTVSNENLASAQPPLHAWTFDHVNQSDYRGHTY